MKNKPGKLIFWTPRILAIIFIVFLSLFSLDVFDMGLDFWGTVVGLLMHNIPVFILLTILLVSWKYEIVGGIVFLTAGLLYITRLLMIMLTNTPPPWYVLTWAVTIAGPAFLIGILFLICWLKKKKLSK
jgi:hypothetical protein